MNIVDMRNAMTMLFDAQDLGLKRFVVFMLQEVLSNDTICASAQADVHSHCLFLHRQVWDAPSRNSCSSHIGDTSVFGLGVGGSTSECAQVICGSASSAFTVLTAVAPPGRQNWMSRRRV